jgi:hypothetical protein
VKQLILAADAKAMVDAYGDSALSMVTDPKLKSRINFQTVASPSFLHLLETNVGSFGLASKRFDATPWRQCGFITSCSRYAIGKRCLQCQPGKQDQQTQEGAFPTIDTG